MTSLPRVAPSILFSSTWVADCSEHPLELVAANVDWNLLRLPPLRLLHPDLWHDGQWSE